MKTVNINDLKRDLGLFLVLVFLKIVDYPSAFFLVLTHRLHGNVKKKELIHQKKGTFNRIFCLILNCFREGQYDNGVYIIIMYC